MNWFNKKSKKNISKFHEKNTPGWKFISSELERVYNCEQERHYGTVIKYSLGGNDPLDGVSIYDNKTNIEHRHIISYGMSEIYYNPEIKEKKISGWGFEFTMRVKPYFHDKDIENGNGKIVKSEPLWVINLMNNLARYVYKSGNCFEPYHFISTNSPIRLDSDTKLVGIIFIPDVELNTINTPNGEVQFLQMFGITKKELEWLLEEPKTYRVKELADKIKKDNPMMVTDLKRKKEYI